MTESVTDILNSPLFVRVWLSFTAVVLPGVVAFFVWGWRAGQFKESDHARRLPLLAHIPGEDETDGNGG